MKDMLWLIYYIPGHYLDRFYGKLKKRRKGSIQPIPELQKLRCYLGNIKYVMTLI